MFGELKLLGYVYSEITTGFSNTLVLDLYSEWGECAHHYYKVPHLWKHKTSRNLRQTACSAGGMHPFMVKSGGLVHRKAVNLLQIIPIVLAPAQLIKTLHSALTDYSASNFGRTWCWLGKFLINHQKAVWLQKNLSLFGSNVAKWQLKSCNRSHFSIASNCFMKKRGKLFGIKLPPLMRHWCIITPPKHRVQELMSEEGKAKETMWKPKLDFLLAKC